MKYKKSILGIIITIAILATCLSGCVDQQNGTEKITIAVVGSSTVLPIAETCAEEYMKANSNIQITVAGGGSSVGIKSVADGSADIGDASREKKESDVKNADGSYKYTKSDGTPLTFDDLYDNIIAYDGIAVVVSPNVKNNGVEDLTMEEIYMIYTGEISNWQDVGGPDLDIFVNDRASTSGTRATFVELIKNSTGYALENFEEDGGTLAVDLVNQENSNVVTAVSGSDKAIGYVGLGYVDEETCPDVAVNSIIPSETTVKDGSYPISRGLHMYTIGAPMGEIKNFIDYVQSPTGQQWVVEEGFISI